MPLPRALPHINGTHHAGVSPPRAAARPPLAEGDGRDLRDAVPRQSPAKDDDPQSITLDTPQWMGTWGGADSRDSDQVEHTGPKHLGEDGAGAPQAHTHSAANEAGVAGSTHEGEAGATVRAAELGIYGRVVLNALGATPPRATIILTDSLANQRVAMNSASATRSRHFLLRYALLKQYIATGDIEVAYVPDGENPSDYLTKWVPAEKTASSLRYAAGRTAQK